MWGLSEQQAKQRTIDLVQRKKSELNLQGPLRYLGPNDPIARELGIRIKEAPLDFDEGQYISEPPTIIIDPKQGDPDRLNFTFFHELMHHLLRQDDELYCFLHEYGMVNPEFKILEDFCNIGAAEFLIPAEDVHKAVKEQGFSITLVEYLDQRFHASKPAIAIQLAQCAVHQCFIIVCEYGLIPQQATTPQMHFENITPSSKPKLYVLYSSSSPSNKYRIARFIPIPKNHIITASYESKALHRGQSLVPLRSGKPWLCECEAYFYKGKVYATFNVSPPISKQQLALF